MKWIDKLLTPIAIALVGGFGSFIISNSQVRSAEKIAEAQIYCQDKNTKSDQQIKVLDIFFREITEGTSEDRVYAINLISSVTPELAKKLLETVIKDKSQKPEVHEFAVISYNLVDESREKQYNQSLSDSARKEKVDFFKNLANEQFNADLLKEALDNYYEVLKISPEDKNAKRKIKEIHKREEH